MHEARATYSRRRLFVLGAALLLAILVLVLLLREQRNATRGANEAATVMVGSSSPSEVSAGEEARRAAIAALGPIKRCQGTNAADLYLHALDLYAGVEITIQNVSARGRSLLPAGQPVLTTGQPWHQGQARRAKAAPRKERGP